MASVSGVCDHASAVVLTDGCMVPLPSDPIMAGVLSPTAAGSSSSSALSPPPQCEPSSCPSSSHEHNLPSAGLPLSPPSTTLPPTAPPSETCGSDAPQESWQQIKMVQGLIERCLQQHMNQAEVVAALQARANVEPSLTSLVWQKLEEQNPDFFNAYKIQLRLKDQILSHNCLVQDQMNLWMAYSGAAGALPNSYFQQQQPMGGSTSGSNDMSLSYSSGSPLFAQQHPIITTNTNTTTTTPSTHQAQVADTTVVQEI